MTATVVPLVQEQTKTCSKCGETKVIAEFRLVNYRGIKHHRRSCNDCYRKNHNAWAKRQYQKNLKFRESRLKRKRDKYAIEEEYRLKAYGYSLRGRFGITLEQAKEILSQQKGKCANKRCGRILLLGNRHTHIDHDHLTGEVRGILCHGCNLALGHVGDAPELLYGLADYLTKKEI